MKDVDSVYLLQDGQTTGPFAVAQLRNKLTRGEISASVSASYKPDRDWRPLAILLATLPERRPQRPAKSNKRNENGWLGKIAAITWTLGGLWMIAALVAVVAAYVESNGDLSVSTTWRQFRPLVFWPCAFLSGFFLFGLATIILTIPANVLLAISRNIMLRAVIAVIFRIARWLSAAVIVCFFVVANAELHLWHLLIITVIAVMLANGLDRICFSLGILADNLFWEQKSEDRLLFVRAIREKAERKNPVWLERVLESEARRREQIKTMMTTETPE